MAEQPFATLIEGSPSLLRRVELLVVEGHRRRYGSHDWSEPSAYRWLRYEDPDPVSRLSDGVRRLAGEVSFDEDRLAEALAAARRLGRGDPGN